MRRQAFVVHIRQGTESGVCCTSVNIEISPMEFCGLWNRTGRKTFLEEGGFRLRLTV